MKGNLSFALVGCVVIALSSSTAFAASKNKPGSRSDYSKEEQSKLYKQALEVCRKKYPTNLSRVKVDYRKKRFVCYIY
jgi:hypothetical protein